MTNAWSEADCLNDARTFHSATFLGSGKVLVAGGDGVQGVALASAELYTPDSIPTLTIHDVQAVNVNSLNATITWQTNYQGDTQVEYGTDTSYGHVTTLQPALIVNHSVLVGGLAGNMTYHFRVLSHDAGGNLVTSGDFSFITTSIIPTNTPPPPSCWAIVPSMNTPRYIPGAIRLLNGKVLIVGGLLANSSNTPIASAELYDLSTNSWSSAGSMSIPRYGQSAILLDDGKVLVWGGQTFGGAFVDTSEIYDPDTNTWALAGGTKLSGGGVLLNNGKILIILGASARYTILKRIVCLLQPA